MGVDVVEPEPERPDGTAKFRLVSTTPFDPDGQSLPAAALGVVASVAVETEQMVLGELLRGYPKGGLGDARPVSVSRRGGRGGVAVQDDTGVDGDRSRLWDRSD